jgi:hypothetical protein
MDETLQQRLVELARRDSETRDRLVTDGSLFGGYHPEMQAVHEANAAELREIIRRHGWPTERTVGADGAEAAWLIAQHAIGLPEFQLFCLAQLERAADQGRVPKWQSAYLTDRIRTMEGRPQIYGTQFDWDDSGEMRPLPFEEPDGVDVRRAAVGLPPLAEAEARQRRAAAAEPKPTDPAQRRRRMDAWARQVGWR